MHPNSLSNMKRMLETYAPTSGLCIDIGSQDFNGSYREIVEARGLIYVGADLEAGKNVDIVLPPSVDEMSQQAWVDLLRPLDPVVIISGSTYEHVEYPWVWMRHLAAVGAGKPGLPILIHTHAMWPEHRYPQDCHRVLPDGMRAVFRWANLDVVEVGLQPLRPSHQDVFGVARIPENQ